MPSSCVLADPEGDCACDDGFVAAVTAAVDSVADDAAAADSPADSSAVDVDCAGVFNRSRACDTGTAFLFGPSPGATCQPL